jgi:hypothetical protein
MSAFPREVLERISSWSEVLTALFGVLAAISAVLYLLANRPIRKIEAHDNLVLQGEVAKAQADAAKGQQDLLEERQTIANRDITVEDQTTLADKLKPFAGQSAVIDVFPVTFEHVAIAGTISGILLNAKWDVSRIGQLTAPSGADIGKPMLVQGIWVQSTGDDKSSKAATALYSALSLTVASGILSHTPLPNPENPRVWIYVGDKPTPLRSWVK